MAKRRHLKKAPIKEAIFDVRVELAKDFSLIAFDKFATEIKTDFPAISDMRQISGGFGIKFPASFSAEVQKPKTLGKRFVSIDKNKIIQTRINGYTFSFVNNYTNWSDFKSQAFKYWDKYKSITKPERISRVALRFINTIPLPLPVDLSKYMEFPPALPKGAPKNMTGFQSRVLSDDSDTGHKAIIQQIIENDPKGNGVNLIFDNDVFKIVQKSIDKPELTQIFSELREYKNDIFFSLITEEAAEMFE